MLVSIEVGWTKKNKILIEKSNSQNPKFFDVLLKKS